MARGETESGSRPLNAPRSVTSKAPSFSAPLTPVEDVWKQRRLRASISEKGAAPRDQPSWRFSLAM
jgi:hypothetical protein